MIKYEIKNNKVYRNIIEENSMNYSIIYESKTKRDCEIWLKLYKKYMSELEKRINDLRKELSKAYLDIENLKIDLENQVRAK